MNTFYGKKTLSSSSSSSIYRYRYVTYSKIPRFQAFWRGAAFWRIHPNQTQIYLLCLTSHWSMRSSPLRFTKNNFSGFLPTKIPMEFWNFGILFCKSLISLKKVDSNFTWHIGPLYIRTSKFQFYPDSKIPISSFQFQTGLESWNNFTYPWNAKSSASPHTRAETYNWFHRAKEKPHQSCD